MPIVVTDNCLGCRFTECVMVCPVSCFHGDETMLYINQELCIECGACIAVCPVHAIFDSANLPEDKSGWLAINQERAAACPNVSVKQIPLPTAEGRRRDRDLRAGEVGN
jgi:ferredoxin